MTDKNQYFAKVCDNYGTGAANLEQCEMQPSEPEPVDIDNERLKAAAVWISRISSGHVTTRTLAELLEWMRECPENRAAFRQMEDLWSRLSTARNAVRQLDTDEL